MLLVSIFNSVCLHLVRQSRRGIDLVGLGLLCRRCILDVLQCDSWVKMPLSELKTREWPFFSSGLTLAWLSYLHCWRPRTIWKAAAHRPVSANCPSDCGEHVSYGQISKKTERLSLPLCLFPLCTLYRLSFLPECKLFLLLFFSWEMR